MQLLLFLLLHSEAVQVYLGQRVAQAIEAKTGARTEVGRVDLRALNGLTVEDVLLFDHQQDTLLQASRLSVNIDVLPLLRGRYVISSAQLFGPRVRLNKVSSDAPLNAQFVIDALSADDGEAPSPIDLQIRSLIIRRGRLVYDQLDEPHVPTGFDAHHVDLNDISAHLILNRLCADSIDLHLKRVSLREQSGLNVKSLAFHLKADSQKASLDRFSLSLPQSQVQLALNATYQSEGGHPIDSTIVLSGRVSDTSVTPSELAPFASVLKDLYIPFNISSSFASAGKETIRIETLNVTSDNGFSLESSGLLTHVFSKPQFAVEISQLSASDNFLSYLDSHGIKLPEPLLRVGDVSYAGSLGGVASGESLLADGRLMSSAGTIDVDLSKQGLVYAGSVSTEAFSLRQLLDDEEFGTVSLKADLSGSLSDLHLKGDVHQLDYHGYTYHHLQLDGTKKGQGIIGQLTVDDPHLLATLDVEHALDRSQPLQLKAQVDNLRPSALHLTDRWGDADLSFVMEATAENLSIDRFEGYVRLLDFQMENTEDSIGYVLNHLHLSSTAAGDHRQLLLQSDFGTISVDGRFDYSTIGQSLNALLASKMPTLPGLSPVTRQPDNEFVIQSRLTDSRFLQRLFDIPLNVYLPVTLSASVNDREQRYEASLNMPSFTFSGTYYEDATLQFNSDDALTADASLKRINDDGRPQLLELSASAADNHLKTNLKFTDSGKRPLRAQLLTDTNFYVDEQGNDAAQMVIHPSEVQLGDAVWYIEPSDIVYSRDRLVVDHFSIQQGQQHIIINGVGTADAADTIAVSLQGIDVAYILDLVNFHSVAFAGSASGQAFITSLFHEPQAAASLRVDDFLFQYGRMGTLFADARLNREGEQIDVDAVALDDDGKTLINGFISPQHNFIDLNVEAHDTRLEFVEDFCKSFMSDVDVKGTGTTRIVGDLKHINLVGQMVANGDLTITPLATRYTLRGDTIRMVPNEIIFESDSIFSADSPRGWGILTGAVHHKELKHVTYDIGIKANDLLAFDTNGKSGDTFYGRAYATGTCTISGRSGLCNIDAELVPQRGSIAYYNAASPDAINDQEFVKWVSSTANSSRGEWSLPLSKDVGNPSQVPSASDVHLNLIIHATPDAALHLIMDNETGDYIELNGSGALRAHYYNNGGFDLYGNYLVDHGVYKLTIQNVIKKDFQFLSGSSIAFGGEPYEAALQLKAQYTVNGVPLSDLQLGRSFTSNNIRVDCQMNITGTPLAPHVDFSLDLPTIGNDAKQMIYSLINSEEEMNQQVLYLLAIGRFYNQGANNATADVTTQSQTSLAMQSLLSGTISQQINNVLSSMINNQNWNFGASITTGDDGFYNAEYEGLLQGRLLNNRLLFNGQFGYRDNANATSSFIGDFDLRYLLYPNGNLAVRVYNQTNDRYFTRNSLTTQGVGLILKKDFRTLRDLLGLPSRRK